MRAKKLNLRQTSSETGFVHFSERERCDWLVSGEQLPQATRSFASSAWIDYEAIDSPTHSNPSSRLELVFAPIRFIRLDAIRLLQNSKEANCPSLDKPWRS